jgi:type VI secretion system protein ImpH
MASQDRRSARDLIAEISEDAPRFRFFQAIRLLALSAPTADTARIPPSLRFRTPLSLAFPASEIIESQSLVPSGPVDAGDVQHQNDPDPTALSLTVGFMGLTGPSGVLPTAYTENLIERRNFHRDTAAHHFLDIFTHRSVSLFYLAWRKHRFHIDYEAGDRDRFTRNVRDLVGAGLTSMQPGRQAKGGIPESFLNHFAGLLSQRPISAASLAALLRGYFQMDVVVEQFIGQWVHVPEDEQTCLGSSSCVLGENAFAGERLWDRQNKIRIKFGPLNKQQFSDLLPGQPGAAAATELVQFCVGQTLACDVTLVLKKECVPHATLGGPDVNQTRLGYNTWLHQGTPQAHQENACFSLIN